MQRFTTEADWPSTGIFLAIGIPLGLAIGCGSEPNDPTPNPTEDPPTPVALATGTRVWDVTDRGDGRDIQIKGRMPNDASGINEFRLFIVKQTAAPSFSIDDAETADAGRFITVTPPGPIIDSPLGEAATDSEGDRITEGTAYVTIIASVTTDSNRISANSAPSSPVTLGDNHRAPPAAQFYSADVGNNGDGSDLSVNFTTSNPVAESAIEEYRIFVATASAAPGFSVETALGVTPANYTTRSPVGGEQKFNFGADALDITGAPLAEETAYTVMVLSLPVDESWTPSLEKAAPTTLRQESYITTIAKLPAATGGVDVDSQGRIYARPQNSRD